jgi:hypothetical protein
MIGLIPGRRHASDTFVFFSLERHAGSAVNSTWGNMVSAKVTSGIHLISIIVFE